MISAIVNTFQAKINLTQVKLINNMVDQVHGTIPGNHTLKGWRKQKPLP